jgi:hypothetical protein
MSSKNIISKISNNSSNSVRKSIKYVKQIDTQIEKNVGYSTKHIIIGVITVIISLLYVCMRIYRWYFTTGFSNGNGNDNIVVNYSKSGNVPVMKRPFLNLYCVMKDGTEKASNIVFITHHFTRDDCETDYNKFKAEGILFLGLSSYSQFPGQIVNPHDVLNDPKHKAYTYDYFKLTRGWCSVFREPMNQQIFPKDYPRINMAESDFANYEQHLPDPDVKKEYDFIYICLKDNDKCENGWQSTIREWEITKQCLDIMCKKYKLKGLLLGRINCQIPDNCHQLMELTDFQEYSTFIKNFNKCRFVFCGSMRDASPRTVSEGICFNLPILMNKNILGGWQYLNEQTGEFFDPNNIENGFEPILDKFIKKLNNNEYTPREWFIKNYGKYNSGKKLFDFVKSVFKEDELNIKYDEVQYMKPGI